MMNFYGTFCCVFIEIFSGLSTSPVFLKPDKTFSNKLFLFSIYFILLFRHSLFCLFYLYYFYPSILILLFFVHFLFCCSYWYLWLWLIWLLSIIYAFFPRYGVTAFIAHFLLNSSLTVNRITIHFCSQSLICLS